MGTVIVPEGERASLVPLFVPRILVQLLNEMPVISRDNGDEEKLQAEDLQQFIATFADYANEDFLTNDQCGCVALFTGLSYDGERQYYDPGYSVSGWSLDFETFCEMRGQWAVDREWDRHKDGPVSRKGFVLRTHRDKAHVELEVFVERSVSDDDFAELLAVLPNGRAREGACAMHARARFKDDLRAVGVVVRWELGDDGRFAIPTIGRFCRPVPLESGRVHTDDELDAKTAAVLVARAALIPHDPAARKFETPAARELFAGVEL